MTAADRSLWRRLVEIGGDQGRCELYADEHRAALGFLSIAQTDELGAQRVRVLDPNSTLIADGVTIGPETVLYPGVIIRADHRAAVIIGERCVLYPGSVLEARDGGRIEIGNEVELGPGGVTVRVTGSQDRMVLDDLVRLTGNCELTGSCQLGRGAQILGPITARSVRLAGGLGGYVWPDPDERGAVLKGAGLADKTSLTRGQVKSCRPSFDRTPAEQQSAYHPPTA